MAICFQLPRVGGHDPMGQILPPSLLHQPKLPSMRAVQLRSFAAEMRQEKSPPPFLCCISRTALARTAQSLGLGTLHLQEVDVLPAPGPMEISRTWLSLPASGQYESPPGDAVLSLLAMERKLQCNLMKY